MNNDMYVITNNPLVNAAYADRIDIVFSDGKYLDVLKLARNKVHEGHKLVTHPLMGSIKPNETPYRSIIMARGGTLDIQSLEIVESSIQVCEKFIKDNKPPEWSDTILKDFQFVDMRLFESALQSITF